VVVARASAQATLEIYGTFQIQDNRLILSILLCTNQLSDINVLVASVSISSNKFCLYHDGILSFLKNS
jgi:hypothetical protein